MTAAELRAYINGISNIQGIEAPLPDHIDVDRETYANVCQFIFDRLDPLVIDSKAGTKILGVSVGKNNGILFKGIELILKEN